MARRDVDEYYNIISEQYQQLLEELKEAQEEDTPDYILDDIKRDIDIVKTNRDRWVYMMYLLNKPKRKEKAKRYEKQYEKKMREYGDNSVDSVIKENEEALERIEEYI